MDQVLGQFYGPHDGEPPPEARENLASSRNLPSLSCWQRCRDHMSPESPHVLGLRKRFHPKKRGIFKVKQLIFGGRVKNTNLQFPKIQNLESRWGSPSSTPNDVRNPVPLWECLKMKQTWENDEKWLVSDLKK